MFLHIGNNKYWNHGSFREFTRGLLKKECCVPVSSSAFFYHLSAVSPAGQRP